MLPLWAHFKESYFEASCRIIELSSIQFFYFSTIALFWASRLIPFSLSSDVDHASAEPSECGFSSNSANVDLSFVGSWLLLLLVFEFEVLAAIVLWSLNSFSVILITVLGIFASFELTIVGC